MSNYIFSDILEIYNSSSSNEDALHKYHTIYEKRVFDYLKSKYLDYLRNWWKSYELPTVSINNCIVLYETRCHPNLEFIIYNLTYFARNWGLIIYCSNANYNFINNILKHNSIKAVLHIIREDEGGREVRNEYNEFTKSDEFWSSLPCNNILMCEMDAYLRKKIPHNVLSFDYICCLWPWYADLPGGGGISFRNVNAMKRICREYPELKIELFAQDSWAAEGCKRLNLSYNNSYLVEAAHHIIDPIGFHNWWTFINPRDLNKYFYIYDNYLTLEL